MKRRITFLLIILVELLSVVKATVNIDSIYSRAIQLAKNQQYNSAINEAIKALNLDARRGDILVFIASTYSWDNKNDSALQYIQKAKETGYHKDDLYTTWTGILLQERQFEALLQCCTEADSQNYLNKEDLFRKRLIAYTELKQYDQGIRLIELPQNKKYLESKKTIDLYSYLLFERNIHLISAYYTLNVLDNGYIPLHIGSLGYSVKLGENKLGIVANYVNESGLNYVQLGTNINLALGNEQFIYLNYEYAFKTTVFPLHRGGIEYYVTFPFQTASSIGGRYLYYDRLNYNYFIATGHLEKFIHSGWIAIRPYYIYNFSTNKKSFSLTGIYRLYSENELAYWGVEIGSGNSPDDVYSTIQTDGFNQLVSYNIKLEKSFLINRISGFQIGISYTNEEFITHKFRNRYTIDIGYQIRLK